MKHFRYSLTTILLLIIIISVHSEPYYDLAPGAVPGQGGSAYVDDPWDYQYIWGGMQAQTGDNGLVGIAFDGEAVWVSGNGTAFPMLYKFHPVSGTLLNSMTLNFHSSLYDLCFDGEYVCVCADGYIQLIDTENMVVAGTIPLPGGMGYALALAYDPVMEYFYLGSFGSTCYIIDRNGNVVGSWAPAPCTAVYGFAWDDGDPTGPWLWIHDQTTPVSGCNLHQFDPATNCYTGVVITVDLPFTFAEMAGGLDFCHWLDPVFSSMLVMGQGNPDGGCAFEMYQRAGSPDIQASAIPETTPVTIPANGGSFTFALSAIHNGDHSTAYDTWIKVVMPAGGTIDTLAGPLRQWIAAGDSTVRNLTQNIPGRAPAGDYQYIVQTGHAQAISWDADTIYFEKLAVEDGEWVEDWKLTEGRSDPSISVPIPDEITLASPYPNPFNNQTTIQFSLPTADNVLLKVFDVQGREVTTLVNGWMNAGNHQAVFNAQLLPSGVYFVRLTVNREPGTENREKQTAVKKVMLVK